MGLSHAWCHESQYKAHRKEYSQKKKWMKGLASSLWYGVWTAELRVNSHRRCWGRWSMRWYMSSRQAVGWSTYFFLPGSGCFCWRPGGWKRNRRIDGKEKRESSQYGLVCDTLHQVIIQPRWRGQKQIHLAQNTNKKGGEQDKSMGRPLSEWNIHFTEQGQSICKQGWRNDKPPQG